jgi:hypothetical protein
MHSVRFNAKGNAVTLIRQRLLIPTKVNGHTDATTDLSI